MQPFEQSIMQAFDQFERDGYVKKVKDCITAESLPSRHTNNVM